MGGSTRITDDQLRELKEWLPAAVLQQIANSTDLNIIDEYLRPGVFKPRNFQAQRLNLAHAAFIKIRDTWNDPDVARKWFQTPGAVAGGLTPAGALKVGNIDDFLTGVDDFTKKD